MKERGQDPERGHCGVMYPLMLQYVNNTLEISTGAEKLGRAQEKKQHNKKKKKS